MGNQDGLEQRGVRGKGGKVEKKMNTLPIQNNLPHLSFQQSSSTEKSHEIEHILKP